VQHPSQRPVLSPAQEHHAIIIVPHDAPVLGGHILATLQHRFQDGPDFKHVMPPTSMRTTSYPDNCGDQKL
jgi:hypothetical protein